MVPAASRLGDKMGIPCTYPVCAETATLILPRQPEKCHNLSAKNPDLRGKTRLWQHRCRLFPVGTIGKRFNNISVENAEENRRQYRQLLFKAGTEMAKHISGVIMFHETFYQKADDGTPLPKVLQDIGIIPGIKVDTGTVTLAGTDDEFTTQGIVPFLSVF